MIDWFINCWKRAVERQKNPEKVPRDYLDINITIHNAPTVKLEPPKDATDETST